MAGVGAASDVLLFLERYDAVDQTLGIPSECLQALDIHNNTVPFLQAKRVLTSWDALYYRLRANFDGLETGYCRVSKDRMIGRQLGKCVFDAGKMVNHISVNARKVSVEVQDLHTHEETVVQADMLLGADGANSIVRRTFMPHPGTGPQSSGYVAFRGVVAECTVSEKTREIFQNNVTYFISPKEHVIV